MRPRVYGTRICPECNGICHEGSWRQQSGRRRRYWCSEVHLKRFQTVRLQERCQSSGIQNWDNVEWPDGEWEEYRDSLFEQVDVITG